MINLERVSSILASSSGVNIDINNMILGKENVSSITSDRSYDREYVKRKRLSGSLFEDAYNQNKAGTLLQDINVGQGILGN